jgi:hypothetical protein
MPGRPGGARRHKTHKSIHRPWAPFIEPESSRPKVEAFPGWWRKLAPTGMSRTPKSCPWVFAYYCEFGSSRRDGRYYGALLFRDKKWTRFGIAERTGTLKDARRIAHRIARNPRYAATLLSPDPVLPLFWRRR